MSLNVTKCNSEINTYSQSDAERKKKEKFQNAVKILDYSSPDVPKQHDTNQALSYRVFRTMPSPYLWVGVISFSVAYITLSPRVQQRRGIYVAACSVDRKENCKKLHSNVSV
jgi:hypothetical protein